MLGRKWNGIKNWRRKVEEQDRIKNPQISKENLSEHKKKLLETIAIHNQKIL